MKRKKTMKSKVSNKQTTTSSSLTPTDLANKWDISVGNLANWRAKGFGPRFFKVGRKVLYRDVEVSKFEVMNLVK